MTNTALLTSQSLSLRIDDQVQLILLDAEPDYSSLTLAQGQTYQLLLALAAIGRNVKTSTLMDLLGLTRPEAYQSRIQHLVEKGKIQVLPG